MQKTNIFQNQSQGVLNFIIDGRRQIQSQLKKYLKVCGNLSLQSSDLQYLKSFNINML